METKLNFYAKDKPLAEVLFSQRKYRIPRYQRPYAWDLEEVSEFWEDLKDMTEQLVQRLKDLEFKWGENEISQRQTELAILAFKHVWSI